MPSLTVTNLGKGRVSVPDPDGGSLVALGPNETVTVDMLIEDLDQLRSKAKTTDTFSIIDDMVDRGLITYSIDAEESAGLVIGHQEFTVKAADCNNGDQAGKHTFTSTGLKLPVGARVLHTWVSTEVVWSGDAQAGGAFDTVSLDKLGVVGTDNAFGGSTDVRNIQTNIGDAVGTEFAPATVSFNNLALRTVDVADKELVVQVVTRDDQPAFYDQTTANFVGQSTLHISYAVIGTGKDI